MIHQPCTKGRGDHSPSAECPDGDNHQALNEAGEQQVRGRGKQDPASTPEGVWGRWGVGRNRTTGVIGLFRWICGAV